ncbi:MAG TPA: hypothetical protein VF690_08590 [Hymenobacter sp.]|jgi:sRNA-binding protein
MKTALEMAHAAYTARKEAERQMQMMRLRQELQASLPREAAAKRALNATKRATTGTPSHHGVG